ncbi:MAG: type I methionyl aminopeptidase [Candidatus Latescibacteria bacterium]|nr:type I methionyl aminopeptidase [Candidatus Latescibacterota bacterium]
MSVDTEHDLVCLKRVGSVVREALDGMRQSLIPGITTGELDTIGEMVLRSHGAKSAPQLEYGFPGTNLISINDEIVHGVPGRRVVQPGDLVTIDVTAELDDFIADAAMTITVEPACELYQDLRDCAETALSDALAVARTGEPIHVIGRAVEERVREFGFAVIPDLGGHGVGRSIHEDPMVLNFYDERDRAPLTEGLVITVEPIVTSGATGWYEADDGWTVKSIDGSPSAHFEHTIVITQDSPIILTA